MPWFWLDIRVHKGEGSRRNEIKENCPKCKKNTGIEGAASRYRGKSFVEKNSITDESSLLAQKA